MKYIQITLLILITNCVFGQSSDLSISLNKSHNSTEEIPNYVLKTGENSFLIDTIQLKIIKPKHIKRIKILKEKNSVNTHLSNTNGTILIYIKRKYWDIYEEKFN